MQAPAVIGFQRRVVFYNGDIPTIVGVLPVDIANLPSHLVGVEVCGRVVPEMTLANVTEHAVFYREVHQQESHAETPVQ